MTKFEEVFDKLNQIKKKKEEIDEISLITSVLDRITTPDGLVSINISNHTLQVPAGGLAGLINTGLQEKESSLNQELDKITLKK